MAPAVTVVDGLPPTELRIACAGSEHVVRWDGGVLSAAGHPDAERERALIALGAPAYPCLTILDRWSCYATDLDVLALAPRWPGDELAPQWASDFLTSSPGTPVRSTTGPRRRSTGVSERGLEIGSLLRLGGGLASRLVLGVVAEWCDRLESGDDRVPEAMPALQAALHGRLRSGLAAWLGRTDLRCETTMIAPDEAASVTITADAVVARLPFRWLRDVWCVGTTTMLGRFTVAAVRSGGTWELTTIGATDGPATTVTIST